MHQLTATEAVRGLRERRISAVELVTSCLERITAREDIVRAWAHLDPDLALRQARERDEGDIAGPLHGLPVGVKDIIDTADQPTGYGAAPHTGHRPTEDAVAVRRLRAAGAIILGKTVTTEFALFHPGPTANPHDPARTPGGSSSGSAAAVADGMVPVALGTQTAGSVVRPSAFCGIFGLKPTFRALDLTGVKAVSPSLDTLGVLARSADDCALVAAALAGDPVPFEAPEERPARIGFVKTHQWGRVDPDVRAIVDAAMGSLVDAGEVEDAELPESFAGLADAQSAVMAVEAAATLAQERRDHADELSQELLAFLDRGPELEWAHTAARELAARCREELPGIFQRHDALVAPAVLGEAPARQDSTGDPLLCRSWTLLGVPAVAVPGLRGPNGLPIGLQVVAAHGHDGVAVAAARWLADRLAGAAT